MKDQYSPVIDPMKKPSDERAVGFFKELEIEWLIHEMKDPISVIETGARTLLGKQERFGGLTARQQKTLNRIARNAQKARDMLYSLLEIGRSESGCFLSSAFLPADICLDVLLNCLETHAAPLAEKIDPDAGRKQVLEILEKNGIMLDVPLELETIEICQDEIKFRQIVGNLLKNALHFRKRVVRLRLGRKDRLVVIEVSDDGPGIAPEHQQVIFSRYRQAKSCPEHQRSGHGLGLAGAKIMAQCLGGDIDIHSRIGKGATFCLRLPVQFASPHA